jgi:hypothetical protein
MTRSPPRSGARTNVPAGRDCGSLQVRVLQGAYLGGRQYWYHRWVLVCQQAHGRRGVGAVTFPVPMAVFDVWMEGPVHKLPGGAENVPTGARRSTRARSGCRVSCHSAPQGEHRATEAHSEQQARQSQSLTYWTVAEARWLVGRYIVELWPLLTPERFSSAA